MLTIKKKIFMPENEPATNKKCRWIEKKSILILAYNLQKKRSFKNSTDGTYLQRAKSIEKKQKKVVESCWRFFFEKKAYINNT